MESRPRLKLEPTSTDKILEISGWIILVMLWILTITFYSWLPEIIPTHFSAAGKANSYGTKMTIWFLPPIATLVFIGLTVLNNYPHMFNYPINITSENAYRQYGNATRMIRSLKLIIVFVFSLVVILIYHSAQSGSAKMSTWFLFLIMGLLFTSMTYFIIKAIKEK